MNARLCDICKGVIEDTNGSDNYNVTAHKLYKDGKELNVVVTVFKGYGDQLDLCHACFYSIISNVITQLKPSVSRHRELYYKNCVSMK